jgi:hypothetical protein
MEETTACLHSLFSLLQLAQLDNTNYDLQSPARISSRPQQDANAPLTDEKERSLNKDHDESHTSTASKDADTFDRN